MNTPITQLLQQKGTQVFVVQPEATVQAAVKEMNARGVGCLLVQETDGRTVGIVTERDCRQLLIDDRSARQVLVRQVMTRDVITVTPDATVEDCMQLMTERRVRHLPVAADKVLKGLISIGDVVKFLCSERGREIENLEKYITGTI